jgi:hypothetical protein
MTSVQTLTPADFFALDGSLTNEQLGDILDRATLLLQGAYAHLPLKEAMFATDPIKRMAILRRKIGAIRELDFHYELLGIFTDLCDQHTRYALPTPWQSYAAYLPFSLACGYDGDTPHYLVGEVLEDTTPEGFDCGTEVTHIDGIPVPIAIEHLRSLSGGANVAASRARALKLLTLRHLAYMPAPYTNDVTVSFLDSKGAAHHKEMPWKVVASSYVQNLLARHNEDSRSIVTSASDYELDAMMTVKRRVFATTGTTAGRPSDWGKTSMPDNFTYKTASTSSGDFAYIRISSFENKSRSSTDDFLKAFRAEFLRMLSTLPQNGLIIDLRGNGGGVLPSGEGLLQFFSPKPIESARYEFVNTPLTLQLTQTAPEGMMIGPWAESIEMGLEVGAAFSQGLTFLPYSDHYNEIGQRYYGPVVLITDGLCYSTTDMVIAAFQDNGIGTILGLDDNTGAGGANVWPGRVVAGLVGGASGPQAAAPLAGNASITVALRRSIRTGKAAGTPIEDLGTKPDQVHRRTLNDLLNGNEDLLNAAGAMLAKGTSYGLDVTVTSRENDVVRVRVKTEGLTSIDAYLDSRPVRMNECLDGVDHFSVRVNDDTQELEVRGYDHDVHAATYRHSFNVSEGR